MMDIEMATGRTTRMIEYAKEKAAEGRAVYVVFMGQGQCDYWRTYVDKKLGITFETLSSLKYFNWQNLRTPGAHRNCLFVVDHYAAYNRIHEMQQRVALLQKQINDTNYDLYSAKILYHAYDKEAKPNPILSPELVNNFEAEKSDHRRLVLDEVYAEIDKIMESADWKDGEGMNTLYQKLKANLK